MIATILSFPKKKSLRGGYYYHVFFKGILDGKSYYTYIVESMRNYSRWKKVLKKGITLKSLKIRKGRLVDADSKFEIVE